jgi:hypothetical protein
MSVDGPQRRGEVVQTRILAALEGDDLRLLEDQDLVARGHVNLLSIDAVVGHLGGRWPPAQAAVDQHVCKALAEALSPDASVVRVSETDYLVCDPVLEPTAARLACLRSLRSTLKRFVGSDAKATAGISAVTSAAAGRIEACLLHADALSAMEERETTAREEAAMAARAGEPFVASDGRSVRIECRLEPVIHLKQRSSIGYRLAPRTHAHATGELLHDRDLRGLAGVDLVKRDLANAIQGLAAVRDQLADSPPASLIVPLSATSLSSQRFRGEVLDVLAEARGRAAKGIICELSGVTGAPTAALEEAVSIARSQSLFLVGKVEEGLPGPGLRALGLRGFAYDCPSDQEGAPFLGWARAAVAGARRAAGAVLFYGVASAQAMDRLASSGATHLTLASPLN